MMYAARKMLDYSVNKSKLGINPSRIIFNWKRISPQFSSCRVFNYVQGQSSEKYEREYFYFIDHNGMLFMDDSKMKNFTSCFKEKAFLRFFFRRLKGNNTGYYEKDFPYVSPCGKEMNYVRCDDLPIVFTHLVEVSSQDVLLYGHAGDLLSVPFEPENLCMFTRSGRVYHPGPIKAGGVGLIKSSLSFELSPYFSFEHGSGESGACPTHFKWKGKLHKLNDTVEKSVRTNSKQEN